MLRHADRLVAQLPESTRTAVLDAIRSATWIKVRRASAALDTCPTELLGPPLTLRVLSTFNAESIDSALRLGLRCMPCRPQLKFAPLNTVAQHLLDKNSVVYTEPCDATVILWRIDELLPDLYYPFSSGGLRETKRRSEELRDRITDLVTTYLEAGPNPLFISTILLPPHFPSAVLDSQLGGGISSTIAEVNGTIYELGTRDPRLRILDVARWSAEEGTAYYDMQMDFMARQPFTVQAAICLGIFLSANLRPLLFPPKKVLAIDLDNTVWGGVLGEDGIPKLKLGQEFPENVFLRIQREILELKHQGILLVLATKNNESEVRQAMDSMPHMLLKWDDFACRKINFAHKYLNLREAANELGLSTNTFALLDDSDYEREQMKAFSPEVLLLNERSDPLHILTSLLHTNAFDSYRITDEDRQRNQDYQLRSARSIKEHQGSVEEFLQSLELRAKLEPIHSDNIDRVVQMLGKTNQFNLTTKRHGIRDLRDMISAAGSVSLTLRLTDKFGEQGIVGVLIALPQDEGRSLYIDSLLISCRAIGRGVEDVLWAALLNHALRRDVDRIVGHFISTGRNGLVATLYERLGLSRIENVRPGEWFLLEDIKPGRFPMWIAVEEGTHATQRCAATASA